MYFREALPHIYRINEYHDFYGTATKNMLE